MTVRDGLRSVLRASDTDILLPYWSLGPGPFGNGLVAVVREGEGLVIRDR